MEINAENRFRRLERLLWFALVGTAVSLMVAAVAWGMMLESRRSITTQLLTVATPQGSIRLGMQTNSLLGLRIFNGAGRELVGLGMFTAGDHADSLTLLDSMGRPRVNLYVNNETPTEPSLAAATVLGPNGKNIAALGVNANTPSIELTDDSGRTRLGLYSKPAIELFDAKGTARTVLGVTSLEAGGTSWVRTESSIVLFDANNNLLWGQPSP